MAIRIKDAAPSVVEYHALRGSYGRVSYFVTKTTLRDVAENLMLAPQDTLTFTERIQRVINQQRVKKEILPYLQQHEFRFFNAMVCILLPDNDSVSGFWSFDPYTNDNGVELGGLGKLKITKDVGRVVLDGQHRFEALRRYFQIHRRDEMTSETEIDVALIFVVVDDIGKMGEKGTKLRTNTITAARNLFAVLNKTARQVDKTTLLLIDDTDIANIMTRSLIEERKIDELAVKWTKAQNLSPSDPYFTAIHVIKDLVCHYLRDHHEDIQKEYGSEEDRQSALDKYFKNTPTVQVATQEAIPRIITESAAWKGWMSKLRAEKIQLVPQPDDTPMSQDSKRALKKERDSHLAYTVAGQRALYRAVIDAFKHSRKYGVADLAAAVDRANRLLQQGLFQRKVEEANPFLGLLFDNKGRMSWAEPVVDCARRIIGVALGTKYDMASILEDYELMSNRDKSIVERYWKNAHSKLSPKRTNNRKVRKKATKKKRRGA